MKSFEVLDFVCEGLGACFLLWDALGGLLMWASWELISLVAYWFAANWWAAGEGMACGAGLGCLTTAVFAAEA